MAKIMSFAFVLCIAALASAAELPLRTIQEDDAVTIKEGDRVLATYRLQPAKEANLSVESGCYFHPLKTPAGITVTEVAPADHPHHRGVFLGFVEMRGKLDADFWGWGQHAPKDGRRIVHRELTPIRDTAGGFVARNEWLADDHVVVEEQLRADARTIHGVNVLDLQFTLRPKFDIRLARWAFSGFCVRTRVDGRLEAHGPDGPVDLPDPSHLKPQSDWPAANWYAYQLRDVNRAGGGGLTIGVAVVDHPKNPPTLWHNHRGVGMINPCIVAPREVMLRTDDPPLVLRYRVIAFDGKLPRETIQRLADDFRKNYPP